MTQVPTNIELEALKDADTLIKYAAENKPTLTAAIALTLAQSQAASHSDRWEPQAISEFWTAFSALCNLVAPVTIDSIHANVRTIPRASWRIRYFGAKPLVSVSERMAHRYMATLVALLFVSLILIFAQNLAKSTALYVEATLSTQASAVEFAIKHEGDKDWSKRACGIDVALIGVREEVRTLAKLFLPFDSADEVVGKPDGVNADTDTACLEGNIDDADPNHVEKGFAASRARLESALRRIIRVSDFIGFAILPTLLGMTGACAYIVRMISEQIRTTTYSGTSSTRHIMRLALGALTGVIVGISGFVAPAGITSALPTVALSFIAGYAIEPVFALIDKIAESFRSP